MSLTPEIIIKRINNQPVDSSLIRGDHDLNPGMSASKNLTSAAVLIGLVQNPLELAVLLTQRTNHLQHHPGQISFPGGHSDPSDNSAEENSIT